MKIYLNRTIFLVALAMFVIGFIVPFFVDKPEDTYKISVREQSIRESGLPLKARATLSSLSIIFFVFTFISLLYCERLDKSLTAENDIFYLRRCWWTFRYSLLITEILIISQIILAFFGLSTIENITYNHIFHSRLWDFVGASLMCIWFFLFTRERIKTIQITPPSVLLEAKKQT